MAVAAAKCFSGLVGAVHVTLGWSGYGWTVGYAVLGYVVLSDPAPRRWVSALMYLSSTGVLVIAERTFGYDQWEMAYNGPLVLVQAIGLIGLVRSVHMRDRLGGPLAHAAQLTFGVYLVHLVFVQAFRITLGAASLPRFVLLLVSWTGTVALSFAVVALWHRRPRLIRFLG